MFVTLDMFATLAMFATLVMFATTNVTNKTKYRSAEKGQNCLHYVRYEHPDTQQVGVSLSPSQCTDIWARSNRGSEIEQILIGLVEEVADGSAS